MRNKSQQNLYHILYSTRMLRGCKSFTQRIEATRFVDHGTLRFELPPETETVYRENAQSGRCLCTPPLSPPHNFPFPSPPSLLPPFSAPRPPPTFPFLRPPPPPLLSPFSACRHHEPRNTFRNKRNILPGTTCATFGNSRENCLTSMIPMDGTSRDNCLYPARHLLASWHLFM